MLRALTCALVAGALAVPATAGTANAAVRAPAVAHPQDITTVIAVIQKVYSIYKQFFSGGGGLTLQAATTQILDAIQSEQQTLIDQIDEVAAASVQGCASDTVIEFNDIQHMTPDTLQTFAMNATSCVTAADSLLDTIPDKAAIDQLGYAVNTIGPLAMMARAYAGLTTPGLRAVLLDADNAVVNRMITDADCTWGSDGTIETLEVVCTAYNGNVGVAEKLNHGRPPGQDLYDKAMAAATVNTSRPVSITALTEI
ncbi:MAG TPA: hypothetical protein VGZ32_12190 [Actinocrinis sp.]|uniref:hypothetical protein n=1 Tax=Actinocrinis sp. TaxID=1920516 RepID=UPI002DDD6ACD|nr:hypothetical protein [Actinocrinis sp.]HEV3171098.1 hypothetical protein [Actinocrinis sp.]